jgi:hypothetical protein
LRSTLGAVSTKDIKTSVHHTTCDVCGRTLLRGESPEPYVAGGERRWVCDLCTGRASQEGWVREGTVPTYDETEHARERRRPLLGFLRNRRPPGEMPRAPELDGPAVPRPAPAVAEPAVPAPPPREPRHVRAIPSNDEHKVAAAVEAFNSSEHPRTVAGVARSLGSPVVCVRASETHPSMVKVVAAWELCWYRYEIDLADELPVRVAAQGAELSELRPDEHEGNAGADENGLLALRD